MILSFRNRGSGSSRISGCRARTRKRTWVRLLCGGILTLFITLPAHADAFDEFVSFYKSRYFVLDAQKIASITCKIGSPTLEALTKQIREGASSSGRMLRVTDTLDSFSITYEQGKGIRFALPSFHVEILSNEGIADRPAVESGIAKMEHGFREVADGTVQMLQGAFEDLLLPDRAKVKITNFESGSSGWKTTIQKEGVTTMKSCTADVCKSEIKGAAIQGTSTDHFELSGNLLRPTSGTGTTIMGGTTVNLQVTFTWQDLGGLSFPARIAQHGVYVLAGNKSEFDMPIDLRACKLIRPTGKAK